MDKYLTLKKATCLVLVFSFGFAAHASLGTVEKSSVTARTSVKNYTGKRSDFHVSESVIKSSNEFFKSENLEHLKALTRIRELEKQRDAELRGVPELVLPKDMGLIERFHLSLIFIRDILFGTNLWKDQLSQKCLLETERIHAKYADLIGIEAEIFWKNY